MKPYKLIIVEDEEIIRNGLVKYIDWQALGFEVVNAFENGEEALEYVQANPFDIILTDIVMNNMSGLEMIAKLKDKFPLVKVVILSGYDDFKYMRQAILYKVDDYLLKPLDTENISMVFKKLKELMDIENNDSKNVCEDSDEFDLFDALAPLDDMNSQDKIPMFVQSLVSAIDLEDFELIEVMLDEFLKENESRSIEEFENILKLMFYMIVQRYAKKNIDVIQITNGMFNYNKISECTNYSEVKLYLLKTIQCLIEGLRNTFLYIDSELLNQIVKYIEEHICENIGNDAIAYAFSIHPVYLSRVFKEKTGETLSEYISRIKMKKAVEFLKSDKYRVSEIAKLLGYATGSYFAAQFKKYTGYTPTEYFVRVVKK